MFNVITLPINGMRKWIIGVSFNIFFSEKFFFLHMSLFFLPAVLIFVLFKRVIYYFIAKIFFDGTGAVAWKCLPGEKVFILVLNKQEEKVHISQWSF